MTRVLVTGGTGFIVQHLVAMLAAQGRKVRVLDLRPPAAIQRDTVQAKQAKVLDHQVLDQVLDQASDQVLAKV